MTERGICRLRCAVLDQLSNGTLVGRGCPFVGSWIAEVHRTRSWCRGADDGAEDTCGEGDDDENRVKDAEDSDDGEDPESPNCGGDTASVEGDERVG